MIRQIQEILSHIADPELWKTKLKQNKKNQQTFVSKEPKDHSISLKYQQFGLNLHTILLQLARYRDSETQRNTDRNILEQLTLFACSHVSKTLLYPKSPPSQKNKGTQILKTSYHLNFSL